MQVTAVWWKNVASDYVIHGLGTICMRTAKKSLTRNMQNTGYSLISSRNLFDVISETKRMGPGIFHQKEFSGTGNRTPSYRVKGGNVSRYTIPDMLMCLFLIIILLIT